MKIPKIKPLTNIVMLEAEDNLKSVTGILLPDHNNVLPDKGKVVAIGPEVTTVKVGQRVLIDRFRVDNARDRGGVVKFGETEYLLFPEHLILAILE